MAPIEAAASMGGDAIAEEKALAFLQMDRQAALSLSAALGFTVLGAASGGLLMFLSFRFAKWMSQCSEEKEPLLPNYDTRLLVNEAAAVATDSEESTTCSSKSAG